MTSKEVTQARKGEKRGNETRKSGELFRGNWRWKTGRFCVRGRGGERSYPNPKFWVAAKIHSWVVVL